MLLDADCKFLSNFSKKIAQVLSGDINYYDFRK